MAHYLYPIVHLLSFGEALPVSVRSGQSDSGWVSGPNGRGTWNLIISAFATILLCGWTAYHPNVKPNASELQRLRHRLNWVLVAVVIPEVVIYCALEQWRTARRLRNELNELCSLDESASQKADEDKNSKEATSGSWSLEYAFYATCGGIAVDSSAFWHQPVLIFTPAGVMELAARGLLPNLSRTMIRDKSKADTFTKLFVCFQAVWFFVQSIARLAGQLPLTLLEMCTLVHVVCVLVVYVLWIRKPYSVEHPTYVDNPEAVQLAALMAIDSTEPYSTECTYHKREAPTKDDVWTAHQRSPERPFYNKPLNSICGSRNGIAPTSPPETIEYHHQLVIKAFSQPQSSVSCVKISESNHLKFERAACRRFGTRLVVPTRNDFLIDEGIFSKDKFHTFITISAAVSGVHLVAWNYDFPTMTEKWLWRATAILAVTTSMGFLINAALLMVQSAADRWGQSLDEVKTHSQVRLAGTKKVVASLISWTMRKLGVLWYISCVLAVLHAFARLFAIVEVLISLRAPPAGTYKTVAWTGNIPHLE
jgi:hypothetical protein